TWNHLQFRTRLQRAADSAAIQAAVSVGPDARPTLRIQPALFRARPAVAARVALLHRPCVALALRPGAPLPCDLAGVLRFPGCERASRFPTAEALRFPPPVPLPWLSIPSPERVPFGVRLHARAAGLPQLRAV